MERLQQHRIALLGILLLACTIIGGCLPANGEVLPTRKQFEKGNWMVTWPSIRPQFYSSVHDEQTSSSKDTQFVHATSHVLLPGNGNNYYGAEATLDVYGLKLGPDQLSQAGVWIVNKGDGQPSSMNGFQAGWQVAPASKKDSHTHFFISWISSGKDCHNMQCLGFHKTSSSITPGDIITPLSGTNGNKQYITIRIFKDKSTGDWHIHYGFNSAPKPVGYLPKSFLPGMIDKPVEINFGGLVYHHKPKPSPPMGNGRVPSSGVAASFSGLKLIDKDGNDHPVKTNIPLRVNRKMCYPISLIDSGGRFSYGGPGCED